MVAGTLIRSINKVIIPLTKIGSTAVDDTLVQTRCCCDGLEGGTGTVQTLCCTVEQRICLGMEQFIIQLGILRQIIGRAGSFAEDRTGLGIEDNDRTAGDIISA